MIHQRRCLVGGIVLLLAELGCGRSPLDPAGTVTLRGVFVPTGDLRVGREEHTATRLASGKVLIVGGAEGVGVRGDAALSVEVFDPSTGNFSSKQRIYVGRARHVATLMGNGQVLIAGGLEPGDPTLSMTSPVLLYDPSNGQSTPVEAAFGDWFAPTTATLLSNGKVLVAGFTAYTPKGTEPTRRGTDAQLYDPGKGTYAMTGSMNADRTKGTGTLLRDGRVLVVGGANSGWTSAELYDPRTGVFTPTGSMAVGRWFHTATLLGSGKVLVAGGERDGVVGEASAELYDPATGTFTTTGSMTVGRSGHTATLLEDGKVLIAGGGSDMASLSSTSAELYDPHTGTFTTTGSMSNGRSLHTATRLLDGRVLVTGGRNERGEGITSAELYE